MPNIFISYSWDSESHKDWARLFADRLIENGIDTYIDQYDAHPGDRLPHFMEQSIIEADYVLIVCTPNYKKKADSRTGGVGYEGHIISGELFSKGNERKFIPIIRKGDEKTSIPNYLKGKYFIDMREGSQYETQFNDLLMTIKGQRKKPSVRRFTAASNHPVFVQENNPDEPIHILGVITDEVTTPKMDGTLGSALYRIPFRLSRIPSALWRELFIHFWNDPPQWSAMHRFGIASVHGDEIVLDGTTMEEVRDYHRDTLKLCVEEANKAERKHIEDEQRKREQEEIRKKQHNEKVISIADDITFD